MNDITRDNPGVYAHSLFDVSGFELEYMIVDKETLNVMPVCDKLLYEISGSTTNMVQPEGESGITAWSNELALHVVEFKTVNPVTSLSGLADVFYEQVKHATFILDKMGARLMPSAMHPWMVPEKEFRIWPHGSREIYNRFDSIFGCKGHGWSNLQSVHINLPFADSGEFTILHNAIRILLPVMNGLTASSPFAEGKYTGYRDYRMEVYRMNSLMIPSITGLVIPDPSTGIEQYQTSVLSQIYDDLSSFDPDGIISHEWVNARGCIPRFDRGSIEIRTLDIQECPAADIACAELFIETIKYLTSLEPSFRETQNRISTEALYSIFLDTIKHGDSSIIHDEDYLGLFGIKGKCTVSGFWQLMAEKVLPPESPAFNELDIIFKRGCLSSRILNATGTGPDHAAQAGVYEELCRCLAGNTQFA